MRQKHKLFSWAKINPEFTEWDVRIEEWAAGSYRRGSGRKQRAQPEYSNISLIETLTLTSQFTDIKLHIL